MSFVEDVKLFNEIAGTKEEFDSRKVSLYVGLVLEEVAEMLDSFNVPYLQDLIDEIDSESNKFKIGENDFYTNYMNREEFLDAAVDIAVVSLGAGISVGSDIVGACKEVTDSNLAKYPIIDGKYTVIKDENGKIKKPEGWKGPELRRFLKFKTSHG